MPWHGSGVCVPGRTFGDLLLDGLCCVRRVLCERCAECELCDIVQVQSVVEMVLMFMSDLMGC